MTDNLSGVMRSATENLHPNIGKLTAGGIERGMRKRRNRRIAQIAGSAASVTAVFGVVAMVGLPGKGASAGVSAASGAQAANPVPHNASTEAAPGPGKPTAPPVSGEQMATWLQQALEPYHFTGEQVLYKAGSNEMPGPYATLRIGYDGQAGSVSLNVARSAYQSGQLPPYMSVKNLPDGSHLEIFNGPEWPAGNGDPAAKRIDVAWYRTDGILVDIQVLNAVQEKGTTTATDLGLTVDQATNVVQSPVWDKAIAAVPAKPVPVKPSIPSGERSSSLNAKKGGGSGSVPGSTPASSPAAPPAR